VRTTWILLALVTLLAIALVLESLTGSAVLAFACMALLFVVIVVRCGFFGEEEEEEEED
jgi:hypothetical protein